MTELLDRILAALPHGTLPGAQRCMAALRDELGAVAGRKVLVAYGGGKDSSYTVAFVRVVQLLALRTSGVTFDVRVVTNMQPGMAPDVLANIARVYDALGMSGDDRCELLLRNGATVGPFAPDQPLDPAMLRRYRADVLMAGHRAAGSGRPTFCNSCNIDMVSAFAAATDGVGGAGGVDLIITGDSGREQRMYQVWIRRLAERVLPTRDRDSGFPGFQRTVAALSDVYFRDLHGDDAGTRSSRAVTLSDRAVRFFSVYDYTDYSSGPHWSFLTGFLGFRFEEAAFNFTESDCANPLLMAHLQGLRAERLHGRDYAEGIAQYLRFGLNLMRAKDMPENLVDVMRMRYTGTDNLARMRARAQEYSEAVYGLSEEQLTCMVFSPFTDGCAALPAYLRREQPQLLARTGELRAVLLGEYDRTDLAEAVERMSGLTLAQARHLVHTPAVASVRSLRGPEPITEILRRDPHKELLDDGGDLISGR
ncbi:hypothetical protein [Actinophytocola sp.]|uniref:hypothetical protein n=1 Tax=Actinophytocola sp. TaxID=1872138 RepID=UPI00389A6CC7